MFDFVYATYGIQYSVGYVVLMFSAYMCVRVYGVKESFLLAAPNKLK